MKHCTYCGRENEDAAVHCHECGTETGTQTPIVSTSRVLPELKLFLRQPDHLAWLAAAIVILQAIIRLSATPYDSSLGEGDVDRLEATSYLWKSAGVATVLVSLGLYFRNRRKVQNAA